VIAAARLRCQAALWLLALALPTLASGGELLDSLEQARLVVVGTVGETRALGPTGRIGTIEVDRRLAPKDARTRSLEVVWEELAPSRPDRFARGRRVLLALEPLPTASIWKRRMPDPELRARVHHLMGQHGQAYLLRPRAHTLDRLEHWLALAPDARRGDAGQVILAQIVPVADPRLALECVAALDAPALEQPLSPALTASILAALEREESGIARALAQVLERRQPPELGPKLEARVAARGADASASLLYAAGALGAKVPPLPEESALGPEQRRALTRWRSGPDAAEDLERSMRGASDPLVRAAAVERYVELQGLAGLPAALRVFDDPEPSVRAAASRAIAALGPDAVVPLLEFARRESGDPARATLATLSAMGEKAHLALIRLADEHEDEDIRTLAGLAVGRPIGHAH
jgi:hypothetical protein